MDRFENIVGELCEVVVAEVNVSETLMEVFENVLFEIMNGIVRKINFSQSLQAHERQCLQPVV